MSERLPVQKYVIDVMSPFPKQWRDHIGPIRVMCEPHEGYVMVRRPGATPFVLSVRNILNSVSHPTHGPFEMEPRP